MNQPSNEMLAASGVATRKSTYSLKRLAIILGVCLLALSPLILLTRCGKSRDAARRELDQKGISFTEDTFLERVKRGDSETAKLFLTAGINPDARDQNGDTVLMIAITANADPVAEVLLNGGASPDVRAKNGSTALHLAALTGNNRIGQLLLKHKADVNAKTDIGETALMIAALRDQGPMVRLLLGAGADINARDNRGETPLMHAAERNHSEIIQMLKNAGAKE